MSLLCHKLIVCTVFNTATVIHNRDFIGVFDCGKSVRDNKGGAVFGEPLTNGRNGTCKNVKIPKIMVSCVP